jgi:hypothetical protein
MIALHERVIHQIAQLVENNLLERHQATLSLVKAPLVEAPVATPTANSVTKEKFLAVWTEYKKTASMITRNKHTSAVYHAANNAVTDFERYQILCAYVTDIKHSHRRFCAALKKEFGEQFFVPAVENKPSSIPTHSS